MTERRRARLLAPRSAREERRGEVRARTVGWAAFLEEIQAEAREIAVSPREVDRLRLFILAGKVAECHFEFAQDLFEAMRSVLRRHRVTRSLLRTAKTRR